MRSGDWPCVQLTRTESLNRCELLEHHGVLVAQTLGDDRKTRSQGKRQPLGDERDKHTLRAKNAVWKPRHSPVYILAAL